MRAASQRLPRSNSSVGALHEVQKAGTLRESCTPRAESGPAGILLAETGLQSCEQRIRGEQEKPVVPHKDCAASTLPLALPSLGTQEIFERILPAGRGLQPVLRFVFQSEGKRLRPRLFYLSARLFNNPNEHLADAAVLVEALHNGTLLHDDVMDRAKVRRNRPTVNRLWGDGVAILAGDFLLAAVMDLALRTEHPSVLPLALETLIQLVEGQMLELQNQGNLSLTEATSMEIIQKKTASLFAMACRLGGLLGRGAPDQVRALESFGLHLGVAFQLLDDTQDYTSVQSHTGKEPGRDLAEAKVTLPVLVAFRQAGTKEKKRIRSIFSDPRRAEHLKELTVLIGELGGFSYTLQRARDCMERAVRALQPIPACPEKTAIEQTAREILRENTLQGSAHLPQETTRASA